jgi:hypothetical protein
MSKITYTVNPYFHPHYGVTLDVNIKLDLAEMITWEADKVKAVMEGIAKILSVESATGLPKAEKQP